MKVEYVDHMGSDLSVVNAARVWKQRTYPTAQKETQDCVKLIGPTMERLFPVSWAALIKE